jgi:hypothetical protein
MLVKLPLGKNTAPIYDSLPPEVAQTMRDTAKRIKGVVKLVSIEIGNELRQVKAILPHGRFTAWLTAELGMSIRSAQRCMVAAEFAGKNDKLSHLPATALQALAAPSTPTEAREEVVGLSEQRTLLKGKDVIGISQKWKNRRSPPALLPTAEQKHVGQGLDKPGALRVTIKREVRRLIEEKRKPADEEWFWAHVRRRPEKLVICSIAKIPSRVMK